MTDHPLIMWWDRIAASEITTQERAILWALARHADWATGGGSRPSLATLAAETGMGRRQVQRYLAALVCEPVGARSGQCSGPPGRCTHRGLLAVEAAATRHRPTTYALHFREIAVQDHLPEIAPARRRRRAARTDADWDAVMDRHRAKGQSAG